MEEKDMIMTMIAKIYELRTIRDNVLKERQKEILKLKQKYTQRVEQIEKDIYKLENASKQLSSAKDFYRFKQEYINKHEAKKQADKDGPK